MPAPKAILRDIWDLGLDPTKPHGAISNNGRLVVDSPTLSGSQGRQSPFTLKAPVEPKMALKELKMPEPEAQVSVVEPAKTEDVPVVEVTDADVQAEDAAPAPKKAKKSKAEKPAG